MQLFYTPKVDGDIVLLEDAEFRHATKTLRKREGDHLDLMDGLGHWLKAELVELGKKYAKLKVLQQEFRPLPWQTHIHLAVAPTKQIDRIEWLLEKAVEIGLNAFTPIRCQHSERKHIRIDRLEKVALAAAKQSHKFILPQIQELSDFTSFIETAKFDAAFIAHCHEDNLVHLHKLFIPEKMGRVLLLIGPEGDFSPQEIALAQALGCQPAGLGASRLRTETAALAAVHSLHLKLL